MSSLINVEAALKSAGHGHSHDAAGQIDALRVREVNALVSSLLDDIEVPFTSLSRKVVGYLSDLKRVLAADYHSVPGMPAAPLVKELARIVETDIKGRFDLSKHWDDPSCFQPLVRQFGPREVTVKAEPYRKGAGLALRGFFCRANLSNQPKFVIFLNTAHHSAAVAATLGHELGHYLYGSLIGEDGPMTAFMEGTFGAHLNEEHELFADALVTLAAYNADQIRQITAIGKHDPSSPDNIVQRFHKAYESILRPRYKIDLTHGDIEQSRGRVSASWRVSYLTAMIHFFKLRCAILDNAGV